MGEAQQNARTRVMSRICVYVQLWVPLLVCFDRAYFPFAPTLNAVTGPIPDMFCHRQ